MRSLLYAAPAYMFPGKAWTIQHGDCDCIECERANRHWMNSQYDGYTPDGRQIRVMVSHYGYHISLAPHPVRPPKAVSYEEAYAQLSALLSRSSSTSLPITHTSRNNLDLS